MTKEGQTMEAEYLLFCAGKSTDENGNLSLHGIFETIYATNFPTQHKPFNIVFRLKAQKAVVNQNIKIKILIEKNDEEVSKLEAEAKVTIEKDSGLVPSFDVSQFVFPGPGIYDVTVYVDGKSMITRQLYIHSTADLVEP
jgi:hypothetical protein